jgi:formylglycine-generating enzyme required for sulfatase activity
MVVLRGVFKICRLIAASGLFMLPMCLAAQSVTSVTARQEGQELVITYTLTTDTPCEVSLHVSTDRGRTWHGPLSNCTGDVGNNISSGNRQIRWAVLEEKEQFVGDGFQFKVIANIRKAYEPEMVFVEGGRFIMGINTGDADEMPTHEVELSSFYIGMYEVTVGQFAAFIDATGYLTDADKGGGGYVSKSLEKRDDVNWRCDEDGKLRKLSQYDYPVFNISWNDAWAYCKWLSEQTGKGYRLPTESEWEYAARGGGMGKTFQFSGSDDLDAISWNNGNSGFKAHPVGLKKPNELGVYDMTGNVSEWCSDWYGKYTPSFQRNPCGPSLGQHRVLRGGHFAYNALGSRVMGRSKSLPDSRNMMIGFRLVMAPDQNN